MNLKSVKIGEDLIKNWYGFELTWSEKLALSHYMDSFKEVASKYRGFSDKIGIHESIFRFLNDYFDIPVRELERTSVRVLKHGKMDWEYFGLGLDEHPNFKEYCKLKINEWREERYLL